MPQVLSQTSSENFHFAPSVCVSFFCKLLREVLPWLVQWSCENLGRPHQLKTTTRQTICRRRATKTSFGRTSDIIIVFALNSSCTFKTSLSSSPSQFSASVITIPKLHHNRNLTLFHCRAQKREAARRLPPCCFHALRVQEEILYSN